MKYFDNLVMKSVVSFWTKAILLVAIASVTMAAPASAVYLNVSATTFQVTLPAATGGFNPDINAPNAWANVGSCVVEYGGGERASGLNLLDSNSLALFINSYNKRVPSYVAIDGARATSPNAQKLYEAVEFIDQTAGLSGVINFKSVNKYNPWDSRLALRVMTNNPEWRDYGGLFDPGPDWFNHHDDYTTSDSTDPWIYVTDATDSVNDGTQRIHQMVGTTASARTFQMHFKVANNDGHYAGSYQAVVILRLNNQ